MPPPVRVAYVVRSWPRLSQTFVLNEVLALERMGVAISIFAMARVDEQVVQPQVAEVGAPVRYLDDHVIRSARSHLRLVTAAPRRYLATLVYALSRRQLLGGYTRSSAIEAFGRAVVMAESLREQQRHANPFTHIHAHFAHDPALIGLLAHRLSGLPFSFTAHARDLYQIPGSALMGRAREASVIVTCCQANADYIQGVIQGAGRVELIYHGVDLRMFRPALERRDHSEPLIVSVGRLVEKKGFDDLLSACSLLAATGRKFRCEIYGEGPWRRDLEALRDGLGLGEIVKFSGERTQRELVPIYQRADVFALTPRVTDDSDRDGVPNVLVEAMACGIPIVSTLVGGIPELVSHDTNGLLAKSNDAGAIAACLEFLLDHPEERKRLGAAAADRAARFDGHAAAHRLAGLFAHDLQAGS